MTRFALKSSDASASRGSLLKRACASAGVIRRLQPHELAEEHGISIVSVFRHYSCLREAADRPGRCRRSEKSRTAEVRLPHLASVLILPGTGIDSIDNTTVSAMLRAHGACRCEFASLLLAWRGLLRARTGVVVVDAVALRLRLDSAGHDPRELCVVHQVGL
jgi:hypothetical protein